MLIFDRARATLPHNHALSFLQSPSQPLHPISRAIGEEKARNYDTCQPHIHPINISMILLNNQQTFRMRPAQSFHKIGSVLKIILSGLPSASSLLRSHAMRALKREIAWFLEPRYKLVILSQISWVSGASFTTTYSTFTLTMPEPKLQNIRLPKCVFAKSGLMMRTVAPQSCRRYYLMIAINLENCVKVPC